MQLLDRFLELFSIHTFVLSKTLEKYKEELEPAQFKKMIIELIQLAEMYAQKLVSFKNPHRRARYIQKEIQRIIDETVNTENVSCKNECSYCCHWRVEITEEEAKILLHYSRRHGIEIDEKLLAGQSNKDHLDPFWNTAKLEQRRCVFLSERGSCRVYDVRPASCRKCLVFSNPGYCKNPGHNKITPLIVLEAELLTSLGWSVSSGEVGLLPQLVQRELSVGD